CRSRPSLPPSMDLTRNPDPYHPEMSPRRSFIIQIDGRPGGLGMSEVLELFRETGVEVDPGYGPIPVNPALGRYVVRGGADEAARGRAEAIPGVRLFADARIQPTS